MSAADPNCATCQGRGTYPAGGMEIPCPCTRRDARCPACPDGDLCDEHWVGEEPPKPGTVAAMPAWERAALARFERTQAEVAL